MFRGRILSVADGKRVKKHVYDSNNQLLGTVVFVYSGGKLVAEYSTKNPPQNPTTKYVATDTLQSVRAITNQDGEIISRRDFLPFGQEIPNSDQPGHSSSLRTSALGYGADDVRQKFTGYQKDEESGLDFAEARMYNNRHARFTAVDPLLASGKSANPQTFNRYVYVMNRPTAFRDPTGLQAAADKREIDVFVTFNEADRNLGSQNWEKLVKDAAKRGNTVNVYYANDRLIGSMVKKSLETPGRFTIVLGHSFSGDGGGISTGSEETSKNSKRFRYQTLSSGSKSELLISTFTFVRNAEGLLDYATDDERNKIIRTERVERVRSRGAFFCSCDPGELFVPSVAGALQEGSTAYANLPNAPNKWGGTPGTTYITNILQSGFVLAQNLANGSSIEDSVLAGNAVLANDPGGDDGFVQILPGIGVPDVTFTVDVSIEPLSKPPLPKPPL